MVWLGRLVRTSGKSVKEEVVRNLPPILKKHIKYVYFTIIDLLTFQLANEWADEYQRG